MAKSRLILDPHLPARRWRLQISGLLDHSLVPLSIPSPLVLQSPVSSPSSLLRLGFAPPLPSCCLPIRDDPMASAVRHVLVPIDVQCHRFCHDFCSIPEIHPGIASPRDRARGIEIPLFLHRVRGFGKVGAAGEEEQVCLPADLRLPSPFRFRLGSPFCPFHTEISRRRRRVDSWPLVNYRRRGWWGWWGFLYRRRRRRRRAYRIRRRGGRLA